MSAEWRVEAAEGFLDPFSTSPTSTSDLCCPVPSETHCAFGAPYFAYRKEPGLYGVVQGCCNHWECPRCGVQVAKQHYGRIVEGARTIAKEHDLWFITITCRGGDLSADDATKHYLSWSSKFLDACYAKNKREGKAWFYVQVTEKQRRGHPHSHILATFSPDDVQEGTKDNWTTNSDGRRVCEGVSALRSAWLARQVVRSGLGEQYDISKVQSVEAASRYVAKYMFKDSQFSTHFPKGWKRVRYSQSWPKLRREKTDAFVLLSRDDWQHLAREAVCVDAVEGETYDTAQYWLAGNDVILRQRKARNDDDNQ